MNQKEKLRTDIVAEEVQRPTLHIEDLEQSDGGHKFGQQCWSAISFKAPLDPFEFANKTFDQIRLTIGPMKITGKNETWIFYNAKIALAPDSLFDRGSFVMIYNRCHRVTDDDERTSD